MRNGDEWPGVVATVGARSRAEKIASQETWVHDADDPGQRLRGQKTSYDRSWPVCGRDMGNRTLCGGNNRSARLSHDPRREDVAQRRTERLWTDFTVGA